MHFTKPEADIFVPGGGPPEDAVRAVTHLGIGAHQDDLEFMAFPGIWECYQQADMGFAGVVCTDGAGSARQGPFADRTDAEMRLVRRKEQRQAATLGKYRLMLQLDFSSGEAKASDRDALVADLAAILSATRPKVVYTHNPADKHATHVAVFAATIQALRRLPAAERPYIVYGCEGWRGLDWVADTEKVALDVSGGADLAASLNSVFQSQIAGGKRYDRAVTGRRQANATFGSSHAVDAASEVCLAIDLSPLVWDDSLDPVDYTLGFVDRFRQDVRDTLRESLSHGSHYST